MRKTKMNIKKLTVAGAIAVSAFVLQPGVLPVQAQSPYQVSVGSRDLVNTPAANVISAEFKLTNTGTNALYLPQVKYRYYFDADGMDFNSISADDFCCSMAYDIQGNMDYRDRITMKVVKCSNPQPGATHYIEIGFKADGHNDQFRPGHDIETRITVFVPGTSYENNDLSFLPYSSKFQENKNISVYCGETNSIIWGNHDIN